MALKLKFDKWHLIGRILQIERPKNEMAIQKQ
jgi:hypothetical protein